MDTTLLIVLLNLILVIIIVFLVRYIWKMNIFFKSLISTTDKVLKKQSNVRMKIIQKGNFGRISKNINGIIYKINDIKKESKDNEIRLKSIIKSVSHGILAIDIEGDILLANKEIINILHQQNKEDVEGHNIVIFKKETKIIQYLLGNLGTKDNKIKSITTDNGDIYEIKIDPVKLKNNKNIMIGYIINIINITENVKLENMRSEFVANVSHELKTPLTSITGFTETIRLNPEMNEQTRDRFMEIIESESNRLKMMIDELLMLSSIEKKDSVEKEYINLYEVYEKNSIIFTKKLEKNNISMEYISDDFGLCVYTNKMYLKEILINLIDNAIKYNKNSGFVKIIVKKEKENIVLIVEDNGLGISKENQQRVFERFYRVNKARNKAIDGTGLGLSIVKHIATVLNIELQLNSDIDKGSQFILKIPKKATI